MSTHYTNVICFRVIDSHLCYALKIIKVEIISIAESLQNWQDGQLKSLSF